MCLTTGLLPGSAGLVEAVFHLWSVFPGPTSLDVLLDHAIKCTNAHSSLPMPGQGVMAGEGVSAKTGIGLGACVNFGMSLEVMAAHEALLAVVTSELSVAEMSLNVGFDVFLATEFLVATFKIASPLVVHRIWAFDVLGNVIKTDVRLLDGGLNAWLQVEV